MERGLLVTMTGPSGVGKTTVARSLIDRRPSQVTEAVSTTTRQPRLGEVEGTSYYFVTDDRFEEIDDAGGFLETVRFSGKRYGIQFSELESKTNRFQATILIVDLHGARQVRERYDGPLLQFYLSPPSWDELKCRMQARGSTDEEIERRVSQDREVFRESGFPWTKVITNDCLVATCDELLSEIDHAPRLFSTPPPDISRGL